jgi:hypothetical protein
MFPLLSGNLDPTWPSTNPPGTAPSWADFISGLAPPFLNPPWAIAMLLAVGVPVLVLTRAEVEEKYRRWGLRLQVIVAAAAVVLVVILVRLYWAAGPASGYPRFWAPVIMTAILMPLVLINRTRGERSSAASLGGVAIFVVVGLALSANPMDGWQELRSVAEDTRTRTVIQSPDRYASVRAEYAQAAAMIPAGSKVLAAVDVPSLLLSRTYELNTLDIAGSTSPSPHLPYFRGTGAKVAWLRSHGYSYVVAVEPSASDCLYNRRLQTEDINGEHGRVYQAWAPYFFDWFDFLASVPDSTRVGDLIVVKL